MLPLNDWFRFSIGRRGLRSKKFSPFSRWSLSWMRSRPQGNRQSSVQSVNAWEKGSWWLAMLGDIMAKGHHHNGLSCSFLLFLTKVQRKWARTQTNKSWLYGGKDPLKGCISTLHDIYLRTMSLCENCTLIITYHLNMKQIIADPKILWLNTSHITCLLTSKMSIRGFATANWSSSSTIANR